MRYDTTIDLKKPLDLKECFRVVKESAEMVGLAESHYYKQKGRSPLQVYRDKVTSTEDGLQYIKTIEEALPVDVDDSIMYNLDYGDPRASEIGADIFLGFFFTGSNLVGRVYFETFIHLDGDAANSDIEQQRQQYKFTRMLHERLDAVMTAVYPPHEEENPLVRFCENGKEKLIDKLELRTGHPE